MTAEKPEDCCVVCGGGGAWAFETLARDLSDALWIDVSETPRLRNYLLCSDDARPDQVHSFIPFSSMQLAADKRLLAQKFQQHGVPCPETRLFDSLARQSVSRMQLRVGNGASSIPPAAAPPDIECLFQG